MAGGFTMAQAVGAFMASAVLITLAGRHRLV
jgi:predicted benzoate:H+ symporter BenE